MFRTPTCLMAAFLFVLGLTSIAASADDAKSDPESKIPIIEPQVQHVLPRDKPSATFAFSRNGKRFAINDGSVARVWDTRTWKEVASFTDKSETAFNYVFLSPDGGILGLTSNGRQDIKLLDVPTGKLLRTLQGHHQAIVSPTFSPDGKTIAATDYNDDLKLWDVATGKDLERFKTKPKDSGEGHNLAFSPDGATLVVATPNGVLHLLDAKKGRGDSES